MAREWDTGSLSQSRMEKCLSGIGINLCIKNQKSAEMLSGYEPVWFLGAETVNAYKCDNTIKTLSAFLSLASLWMDLGLASCFTATYWF